MAMNSDNKKNETGSGAADAVVQIAKAALTVLLLCVMVGGGVCGICMGVMDLDGPHSNPSEGMMLIFLTLAGIAIIGFVLWLMWSKKKPAPREPEQ